MIEQRIKTVAVTKVTLVDSQDKMRPAKTPTPQYSIMMGKNLNNSSKDSSKEQSQETLDKD